MVNRRLPTIIAVALVVARISRMSRFIIVDRMAEALVLRLGEVRDVIPSPGLKMKCRLSRTHLYDNRLLDFGFAARRFRSLTGGLSTVYALSHHQSAVVLPDGQPEAAVPHETRELSTAACAACVPGNVTLSALLSHQASGDHGPDPHEVTASGKSFGIDVDVRSSRLILEENSQAILPACSPNVSNRRANIREGPQAAQTSATPSDRTVIPRRSVTPGARRRVHGEHPVYAGAFGQDVRSSSPLPLDAGLS
jgi:hypothetical protein